MPHHAARNDKKKVNKRGTHVDETAKDEPRCVRILTRVRRGKAGRGGDGRDADELADVVAAVGEVHRWA